MNWKILSLYLLFFLSCHNLFAHQHELAMKIKNAQGQYVVRNVMVYYHSGYGEITFHDEGSSCSDTCFTNPTGNWACDIDDSNSSGMSIDPMWSGTWVFRIEEDNKYLRVSISSVGEGEEADFQILYDGSTFSIASDDRGVSIVRYGDWTEDDIVVKNNFSGGQIKFDYEIYSNVGINGQPFNVSSGSFPHYVTCVLNQTVDNYFREWRNWSNDNSTAYTRNLYNPLTDFDIYEAIFAKKCNVVIQNSWGIDNNSGTIKFESSSYSSPTSTIPVYDDVTYSIEAQNQTVDGIYLTFDHWTKGEVNIGTSNPLSIIPDIHTTYTAHLTGRPTNTYRNLHFNDDEPGEEVLVQWNKHPLDPSEVTKYEIWRRIRYNGVTGSPVKIHTKTADGSSTYTYTDTGYMISYGYNGYIYYYDVKAYYAPDQTYSNDDYIAVYAEAEPNIQNSNPYQTSTGEAAEELPLEYSLSNFPNPFNPSTTIRYSLAQNDFVTIKIYDMLGKEISTLVNEEMQAGINNVEFNAGNLPSGVYIYSIIANNFKQSRKMILNK